MVEALSQRLAGEFRRKIERGEWTVGVRLPTTRELAASYHVSVNTIQNAFRELEVDDLIERRPRIGGFVKSKPQKIRPMRTATTFGVVGPLTSERYSSGGDDWGVRIVRGCESELTPAGFHISMFSYVLGDTASTARVLEKIDQAGDSLAGVLCFIQDPLVKLMDDLDKRNIPWVTVNRHKEHAAHNFVTHDAFTGARLVGRCFAKLGYERVAIVSDRLGSGRSSGDKYFGFMEGWIESGRLSRDVDFVNCETYHEEVGHRSFSEYLSKFGPPRGVLASGDLLALGAIRACREAKLSVPDQVSVIGSTGLNMGAYTHPSLTVLDTPMEQMGRDAAQMLLSMAREGVRRMMGRYAKANLIIRESCRIPQEMLESERIAIEQSGF